MEVMQGQNKGVEVGDVIGGHFTGGLYPGAEHTLEVEAKTPGLSIKMAGLSVDEEECICTINCRAEHTPLVGPRSDVESTGIQSTS